MKKICLSAMFMALSMGVFAAAAQSHKTDTLVVTTNPQMHCQSCEKRIKSNIRFVKGTKSIDTSIGNQTVTIVYDPSKTAFSDFVAAFKKIGYEIKDVKKGK